MKMDVTKLNSNIMALIKTIFTLSAPFLRKSLSSLGDIHVLGCAVGNETRSYVGSLEMLKGLFRSNSVLGGVDGSAGLVKKIDMFNIVSKKVADCTVGVNLYEVKVMIGQDLINKAIDALHKATKASKSPSVNYQDTINELDKSLTGLEGILRGADDLDGIGAMCTRLKDANVQYKKLPDGTNLVSAPVKLLQDMCLDTQKCIAALPHTNWSR